MSERILVVEDEPGIREMLAAWLRTAGFECDTAGDAETALEAAGCRAPDAALLDIALPGKDGVWLARALRQRHYDTALIMVTGLQRFDAAVRRRWRWFIALSWSWSRRRCDRRHGRRLRRGSP